MRDPEPRGEGRADAREPNWAANYSLRARDTWEQALELAPVWLVVFLVVATLALAPTGTFFSPKVEAGAIATRDYVAVRDLLVPDHQSTEERRLRARQSVLPVYDFDSALTFERAHQIAAVFAEGRITSGADQDGSAVEGEEQLVGDGTAADAAGLRIPDEVRAVLEKDGYSQGLEERLRSVFLDVLGRGAVADKSELLGYRARGITRRDLVGGLEEVQLDIFEYLAYPDEVRVEAAKEIRGWKEYSSGQRSVLTDFVVANVTPNLLPNRSETLARQDSAEAATGTVFIQVRKGQMIARTGDEISATAADAIAQMAGESGSGTRLLPWLGSVLMLSLAALLLWVGLKGQPMPGKSRRRTFSEVLLLLLAGVVGARFGFFLATALSGSFEMPPLNSLHSYLFAVPFASLAMVAELLYGRVVALLLTVLLGVLVGRMAGPGAGAASLFAVASSLTGIYALGGGEFKQRSALTRAGLKVGLANVVLILMLVAVSDRALESPQQISFDIMCGLVGGLLAAAAASFALPILETLFSITTDIKLIELANTNLPLLRRMAYETPGTFQHSLMVANLAKTGCEAVGADSVLAYTGGLYHDIGKLRHPEYFIENQRPGHNPHDDLPPIQSAAILVEHISYGLDLARRYHLPRPLRDAIEQHHGSRLMTFFHSRALERAAEAGDTVEEINYRYPGPRPQNKVMAILMLADAVEAASRTLVDGSPERIRKMVGRIVDACVEEGQLDKTDLTLSDIREVAESFERVLVNLYHRRIDYPGYDFNLDRGTAPAESEQVPEVWSPETNR